MTLPPPRSSDHVRGVSGRPPDDCLDRVGWAGRSLGRRLLLARDCLLGVQNQKPQRRIAIWKNTKIIGLKCTHIHTYIHSPLFPWTDLLLYRSFIPS